VIKVKEKGPGDRLGESHASSLPGLAASALGLGGT